LLPGFFLKRIHSTVAKTTPIEFIRQVQAETKKVVWPSRKETIMTGVMVMIMTTVLAVFFFGVDKLFHTLVTLLLSLAAKG
jgi:preprotein translocase subunit SecE